MSDRTGQARPDFSGKWTLVPGADAVGGEEELTITQDASTLTLEQMGRERRVVRLTFRLDGSETQQTINRNVVVTRASWDGSTLVTTVKGDTADWKDVWSLDGGRLVIVTTTPGRTLTITRTFKKAGAVMMRDLAD